MAMFSFLDKFFDSTIGALRKKQLDKRSKNKAEKAISADQAKEVVLQKAEDLTSKGHDFLDKISAESKKVGKKMEPQLTKAKEAIEQKVEDVKSKKAEKAAKLKVSKKQR